MPREGSPAFYREAMIEFLMHRVAQDYAYHAFMGPSRKWGSERPASPLPE